MDTFLRLQVLFWLVSAPLLMTGCLSSNDANVTTSAIGVGGPVLISWTANREAAVGAAGGGYRVYYSQTSGVALSSTSFIDVPHSGGTTPTSVTIPFLPPGLNYIRVVAYTASKPTGSAPSSEVTVNVP